MSNLPAEIQVVQEIDKVHYRLPRPNLGAARWVALLLLPFGLMPLGMSALFVSFVLINLPELNATALLVLCLMMLVPLGFAVGGGLILFVAVWLLFGHCEVELTPSYVRGIWRVGPFWLSRRRKRSGLRKFTVVNSMSISRPRRQPAEFGSSLQAEYEARKPLLLANGYSRESLLALAGELVEQTRLVRSAEWDASLSSPVSIGEESTDPDFVQAREERPPGSTAILERVPGGISLILPPAGLVQGSGCFLFVWTVGWNLMATPMALGLWIAAASGNLRDERGQPVDPWFAALFPLPFLAVAVGSIFYVLHAGRRRATIIVRGNILTIERTGLFGNRAEMWAGSELSEVRVQTRTHTTTKGGTQRTTWLVVVPRSGAERRFFSYRDKSELEWIATLLRGELQLGTK